MRRQAVGGLALLLVAACLLYISQGAHVEQVSIEHCAGPGIQQAWSSSSSSGATAAVPCVLLPRSWQAPVLSVSVRSCCSTVEPPVCDIISACVTLPLLPEQMRGCMPF